MSLVERRFRNANPNGEAGVDFGLAVAGRPERASGAARRALLVVQESRQHIGTVIRELPERSGAVIDVWGTTMAPTPNRAVASGERVRWRDAKAPLDTGTDEVWAAAAPSRTAF